MLATRSDLLVAKERIFYSIRDAYLDYQAKPDATAQKVILKELKLSPKFTQDELTEFCTRSLKTIEKQISTALSELNPVFGWNRTEILDHKMLDNVDGKLKPILKFNGDDYVFIPDLYRAEENEKTAAVYSPNLQITKDKKVKKIASKMELAINALKSKANTVLGGIQKALDERFSTLPMQKKLLELSSMLIVDEISPIFKAAISKCEIECAQEKSTGSGKFDDITSKVNLFMLDFVSETKITSLANYILLTFNKAELINFLSSYKKLFPELFNIKSFNSFNEYLLRVDEFYALANFNSLLLTNDNLDKSKAYLNLYMDLMSELEILKDEMTKINLDIKNQYTTIKENQLFNQDSGLYLKLEDICNEEIAAIKMQELDNLILSMQSSRKALLINGDASLRLENFYQSTVEAGIGKKTLIDFHKPRKELLEQGLTTEKRKIEILYVDELPEIALDLPEAVELVSKYKINKEVEYKLAQNNQDFKFVETQYQTNHNYYNEVKKSITTALSSSFSNSTQDASIKRLISIREDCEKFAQTAKKYLEERNVIVAEINKLGLFRENTQKAQLDKLELHVTAYKSFLSKLNKLSLLDYHIYDKYNELPLFVFASQYKDDLTEKLQQWQNNFDKISSICLEMLDANIYLSQSEIELKIRQIDECYAACSPDVLMVTTIDNLTLLKHLADENALLLAQSKVDLPEFDQLNLQHHLLYEYNAYCDAMQKVFTQIPNENNYSLTLKTLEENKQKITKQYEENCVTINDKIKTSKLTLSNLVFQLSSLKKLQAELDEKINLDNGVFLTYGEDLADSQGLIVTNQYYNSCKNLLNTIHTHQSEIHAQIKEIENAIAVYNDKSGAFDSTIYEKLLEDNAEAVTKHDELLKLVDRFRDSRNNEYFQDNGYYVNNIIAILEIESSHLNDLYRTVCDFAEKCIVNEHLNLADINYKNAKTPVEKSTVLQNLYEFTCNYLPKNLELHGQPKLGIRSAEKPQEPSSHNEWEQAQHTATLSCLRTINRLSNPNYREQAYHTINPVKPRHIVIPDFSQPRKNNDGLAGEDDKPPQRLPSSTKSHLPPVPPKIKKPAWTVFKQHMGKILGSISGFLIGGGLGALFGFLLVPVTFGVSLPLGAAIGMVVGGAVGGTAVGLGLGSIIDCCLAKNQKNKVENAVVPQENSDDVGNIHKRFSRGKSYSLSQEDKREDISNSLSVVRSQSDPITAKKSRRSYPSSFLDHAKNLEDCDYDIKGFNNSKSFGH